MVVVSSLIIIFHSKMPRCCFPAFAAYRVARGHLFPPIQTGMCCTISMSLIAIFLVAVLRIYGWPSVQYCHCFLKQPGTWVTWGAVFAGGIGALALACESRVSKCHLHVPTFGHHLLRLKLPSHGSASSVQKYYLSHDKRKTLRVLRYYDAASAAAQISMPVHCACATFDPCVAPPGQFAIYNAIAGKKKLFILDAGHHDYADKFLQEQKLIVDLAEFFDSPDNPGV
jgi:hypothetical protein